MSPRSIEAAAKAKRRPYRKNPAFRRSMVIYHKWIVNGRPMEIDNIGRFVEAVAAVLADFRLASGNLVVFSTDLTTMYKKDVPRIARLELLNTEAIVALAAEHMLAVAKVLPRDPDDER